ncbi:MULTISPECIES: UvrD-helicase domain-containing protein [Streptomyces]|uniref:UvrD-helicase domain-containing protein n=1 Tax=Streptomyces TaxID=1883 RepID=UPI0015FF45D8|nr:UvrD-helicase domain-containing protein [Streptomyces murinus]MBA9049217.1 superfamily I DNA/RNA helicase [Streptomyces murinus]
MPHLAFDIGFCAELHKLQPPVKKGVFDAWEKFKKLTLQQLFKDPGLKLESLTHARDPHIRTIRITDFWRGVVLAPGSGEIFVLLKVMQHDAAIAWAKKQKSSINAVTRAVEIRDAGMLEELAPAAERMAAESPDRRLFDHVTDKELRSLGVDEDTLRQARSFVDKEQLELFAPYLPADQREVLEYLAEGFSVQQVWQEVVAYRAQPADTHDYDTAIRNARSRITLVTASKELQDILEKPFAAWRVFLHPSQHRVAYRPSYSGPAQVTGGPGTGKTVVALHRVRHLLGHLRDGERILLTTYTNALVHALRSGLRQLVDDPGLLDRVDVCTVDAFAHRAATRANAPALTPLNGSEEEQYWIRVIDEQGLPWTAQFLAQEYRHVVLAQDLTNQGAYQAAQRRGRGSALPSERKPLVWQAVERFKDLLAEDQRCTYLQRAAEAARSLADAGPLYRHIVVDEAQDLHPAQWRLLRAAVPECPDDLFIAGDPHQRIYDAKVSLKALGIKVSGRSTKMRKNCRSTQEILSWAVSLLARRPIGELADDEKEETFLGYRSALHGGTPLTHDTDGQDEELEALSEQVRKWIASGVRPGEIGIATRFNRGVGSIVSRLSKAGIPARRLRAESADDADEVAVGTMHALKGLEFRCIGVFGVNEGAVPYPKAVTPRDVDAFQHGTDLLSERCLLFVACTRAREQLYVSWSGKPSPFLQEAGLTG